MSDETGPGRDAWAAPPSHERVEAAVDRPDVRAAVVVFNRANARDRWSIETLDAWLRVATLLCPLPAAPGDQKP